MQKFQLNISKIKPVGPKKHSDRDMGFRIPHYSGIHTPSPYVFGPNRHNFGDTELKFVFYYDLHTAN